MRWSLPYVVIAATLVVAGVPARAQADPIVLTEGVVATSSGSDLPGFTLSGNGSFFRGVLGISGGICCGFSPGDVVKLGSSFPISLFPFQPTTQIVDGTSFPATFLRGELNFTTAPFVAPTFPAGSESLSFTTSFAMTGQVSGFTGSLNDPFEVFSVPVVGTGIASVSGSVSGSLFIGTSLGYAFRDPAPTAPTPEPATLVFVGTALIGGLGAAVRRKRSAARAASKL